MSFDPGQVMVDVDAGAARLEKAADTYSDAVLRYEKAEAAYDREFQKKLLVVFHKAKSSDERPPAEDLRRAMAHELLDADIYSEFLDAKGQKESLAVRYRALSAAVSARQSLLKALQ